MKHRIEVVAIVLVAVAGACLCVHAQEPVPTTKNYVAWAHEFLQAMYPDLNGKKYILSAELEARYDTPPGAIKPFALYIGEDSKYAPSHCCFGGIAGMTPPPRDFHPWPRELLRSGFGFDNQDHLEKFGADGPGLGNREVGLDLAELVRSHPEWTDSQVAAALKKAGAKYGPDDREEFLKDPRFNKLEHFLGKLEIVSVSFDPLDRSDDSHNNVDTWPLWLIKAKVKLPDGTVLGYKMRFEPYKGDLINLWRVPNALDPEVLK